MALQTVGWLQNAGAVHTAAQMRMYHTMLQAGNFSSANTIRARGGVHPNLGQELVVTQAGSPNMTVLVETGYASIPGTESALQGNYYVVNDAQVTLSITAAHATLARIDIVVINVRDAFYSGVSNDVQLQVIAGTPASSPVAPAAPVNAIIVAEVAVGAGVTSITNANITDVRFYMAAAGGVIHARTEATRPPTAEISEGQLVWTRDANKLWVHDGAAYNQLFPGGYTKVNESILVAPAASILFSSIPSTYRSLRLEILGRGDTAAAFIGVQIRFNADATAIYDSQQMSGNATTIAAFEAINATGADIGEIAAASATAGAAGMMTVTIPFYAGTTFWKLLTASHQLSSATGTAGLRSKHWASRWRNTAAITSITILPTTGNFIAGTSATLYGEL